LIDKREADPEPSWNVAPTDPLPVVRCDAKASKRSLDELLDKGANVAKRLARLDLHADIGRGYPEQASTAVREALLHARQSARTRPQAGLHPWRGWQWADMSA
jgi:hypothetical protein